MPKMPCADRRYRLLLTGLNLYLMIQKRLVRLTYAPDNYQTARNLIAQARAALTQDNFDEAKSLATQAESYANKAKIAARRRNECCC